MNKKLYIPLIIIFLDVLWFSFILPSIPFIVKWFWVNSTFVWLVIWLTALWMFFWWIIFWKLSDKYGRKNILIISILINILWYLLFWLSFNLLIFATARFLNWFWWWAMSVVQAYIWDISEKNEKITNLWYIWASIWLWFLLWPVFWYFLAWYKLHIIWYYSAFLLFISLIVCFLFFENHNQEIEEKKLLTLNKYKKIYLPFLITFSLTLTLIWLQTIFPFFLETKFNLQLKEIYLIFWYIWIIAIFYQVFFLKIIKKLLDENNILKFWLICIFFSLIFISFNTNFYVLLLMLLFFSIWLVNTNVSLFSIIISHSSKKEFWTNLWLNTAFWSIWEIFWALISGYLYTFWTYIPFLCFAFFIMLTFLLFIFNFND